MEVAESGAPGGGAWGAQGCLWGLEQQGTENEGLESLAECPRQVFTVSETQCPLLHSGNYSLLPGPVRCVRIKSASCTASTRDSPKFSPAGQWPRLSSSAMDWLSPCHGRSVSVSQRPYVNPHLRVMVQEAGPGGGD